MTVNLICQLAGLNLLCTITFPSGSTVEIQTEDVFNLPPHFASCFIVMTLHTTVLSVLHSVTVGIVFF